MDYKRLERKNQRNRQITVSNTLNLHTDWTRTIPIHILIRKKRYAYLVNWKRRKFHNYTQGWHSGSHAIAWAAITTFVCTGFLRPPIQNVAFAVPRFDV